jgi:hypothetical protein
VRGENRTGVAEDQVFVSVKDPFLAFREMTRAQETLPLGRLPLAGAREGILDSLRIMLDADGKSAADKLSFPDSPQRFASPAEIGPRLFLPGEKG